MNSKTMRQVGWLAFGLMWVPFTALMVSITRLPEGGYDWSGLPPLMQWSMVGVGFFALTSMLLILGAPFVSWLSNRAVLAKGLSAEATILQISDTGTAINDDPVIRLLLKVYPPDRPAFQAETEQLISYLQLLHLQPGTVLRVKYNPATQDVTLVK